MKHGKRKVTLHPGDFLFGEPGTHIHTLLGSCVAITLWHPRLHIGGMCHFVLPTRPNNEPIPVNHADADGRYGNEAMILFEIGARLHGTKLNEYQGKIFGGANMFGQQARSDEDLVGERNAAAAITMLMQHNIDVAVAHVGETGHRRVVMDVGTGEIWVKHTADDGKKMDSTSGIS